MMTIIAGTNRKNSYTLQVANYYKKILHEAGVEDVKILDLSNLPPDFAFTALYDNQGKNNLFNPFIQSINDSKKFIFIVPEYNGSFPGVLKAFIDGLDFPAGFKNKKCALVGIGTGSMGGALAVSHMTDILNYLGMHVLALKPRLPRIHKIFNENVVEDIFLEKLLREQVQLLIEF